MISQIFIFYLELYSRAFDPMRRRTTIRSDSAGSPALLQMLNQIGPSKFY